jgi:hypothetical protein
MARAMPELTLRVSRVAGDRVSSQRVGMGCAGATVDLLPARLEA